MHIFLFFFTVAFDKLQVEWQLFYIKMIKMQSNLSLTLAVCLLEIHKSTSQVSSVANQHGHTLRNSSSKQKKEVFV